MNVKDLAWVPVRGSYLICSADRSGLAPIQTCVCPVRNRRPIKTVYRTWGGMNKMAVQACWRCIWTTTTEMAEQSIPLSVRYWTNWTIYVLTKTRTDNCTYRFCREERRNYFVARCCVVIGCRSVLLRSEAFWSALVGDALWESKNGEVPE